MKVTFPDILSGLGGIGALILFIVIVAVFIGLFVLVLIHMLKENHWVVAVIKTIFIMGGLLSIILLIISAIAEGFWTGVGVAILTMAITAVFVLALLIAGWVLYLVGSGIVLVFINIILAVGGPFEDLAEKFRNREDRATRKARKKAYEERRKQSGLSRRKFRKQEDQRIFDELLEKQRIAEEARLREEEERRREQERQEARRRQEEERRYRESEENARRQREYERYEYDRRQREYEDAEARRRQRDENARRERTAERPPSPKEAARMMYGNVSSKEQLETKHRALQKSTHPDNNNGDDTMYRAIQEVYEELARNFA